MKIFGAFVMLALGIGLGWGVQPDHPVPTIKTVEVPGATRTETIIEPNFPASCQRVVDYATVIAERDRKLSDVYTRQLDILDESYMAIVERDWSANKTAENKQRVLERSVTTDQRASIEASSNIQFALAECRKDSARD